MKETRKQKKAIAGLADACLKNLARVERDGKRVMVIHGFDEFTLCECSDEVDAEVIVRLMTDRRERVLRQAV